MKNTKNPSVLMRAAARGKSYQCSLALGLALTALSSISAQAQVTLDPSWRVTPDTSKPGFKWNYFQTGKNTGNNTTRTESDLAGLSRDATGAPWPNLGDPNTVGAAMAPAAPANPTNGLLYFEITNVINLSKSEGGSGGYFPADELEPGVDLTVSTDGQSAEILTYLTLAAGTNYMGLNADDGVKVESGSNPLDKFGRTVVAEFSGGAGIFEFSFVVQQAGTYPFRTIWENGGGGSAVEWYSSSDGTNNRVLINDVANGGIPAYRAKLGVSPPYVRSVAPDNIPRQTEATFNISSVVLVDGTTAVNTNSIALQIDGKPAPITLERSGANVTVNSGVFLSALHLSAEVHTAVLTFKDVPGTYSRTQAWTFANIENLILPASPVIGENFDAYPEATDPTNAAPPGWTLTNYSWLETGASGFGANGGNVWDLTAQHNDPYLNWCMVDTNTAFNLESEILDNYKGQTINGIPVTTSWMAGNCLFAASDGRARHVSDSSGGLPDYAPQIQIVVSAPFNLSTVTNPVLTWSSAVRLSGNGEEDGLEYSVDNGVTWLPAFIVFNNNRTFLNSDGTYDAVKMLTNIWADVAKFPVAQDSSTRDWLSSGPLGQKFGDVLKVPITPALSPYIAERNDSALARKVEAIRLPAASKKSQVRLRFNHYGSCGWEWAIDNIAFYDIAPPATQAPVITSIVPSGANITIQWTGGGTLESATSLTTPTWVSTGNSSGSYTEARTPGNKFYRVKQ